MSKMLDAASKTLHVQLNSALDQKHFESLLKRILEAQEKQGFTTVIIDFKQQPFSLSITDIPNFVDQLSPKQKLQHLHFTIIYSTPNNALSFLETYLLNRGFNLRVVRNREEARVLVAD